MNITQVLDKLKGKAEGVLKSPEESLSLITKVQKKFKDNKLPRFKDFKQDMETALDMLKDYSRGRYTKTPWQSILMIVGAFIYFLNPLDIIPDFIPIKGFLDDASILVYVLSSFKEDLSKYRVWKDDQKWNGLWL